jgi:hypothetical protein
MDWGLLIIVVNLRLRIINLRRLWIVIVDLLLRRIATVIPIVMISL